MFGLNRTLFRRGLASDRTPRAASAGPGPSPIKPHISNGMLFNRLLSDQLIPLLGDSWQYALAVIGERNMAVARLASSRSDELFAAFHLLLEWHSLLVHRASFAEHFYGFERQRLFAGAMRPRGSRRHWPRALRVLPAVALLVLVPYARRKSQRLARGHDALMLAWRMIYLLRLVRAWSPFELALGVRVVPAPTGSRPASRAGQLLAAGLLFYQFSDWWIEHESELGIGSHNLPPPPPKAFR